MTNSMCSRKMYRLADDIQVRKEKWGLLFYSQWHHRVCFIRSGNLLKPEQFEGRWIEESLTTGKVDIPQTVNKDSLDRVIGTLLRTLVSRGIVVYE